MLSFRVCEINVIICIFWRRGSGIVFIFYSQGKCPVKVYTKKPNRSRIPSKVDEYRFSYLSGILKNFLICNRKYKGFFGAIGLRSPSRFACSVDKCESSIYRSKFSFSKIEGAISGDCLSKLNVAFVPVKKIKFSGLDDFFLKPLFLIISQLNFSL